ncbi:MAG: RNA methyltransferase, partial [Desulfobacterales bacterium]|nr:RNA methyltransferase [Desulfobacterales bacterium]
MNALSTPNLHLALLHYPVVNKNGEPVASAVTNLDLHDISRA